MEHRRAARFDLHVRRFKAGQRDQHGARNVLKRMFVRLADIDQVQAPGLQAFSDIGRFDFRQCTHGFHSSGQKISASVAMTRSAEGSAIR